MSKHYDIKERFCQGDEEFPPVMCLGDAEPDKCKKVPGERLLKHITYPRRCSSEFSREIGQILS